MKISTPQYAQALYELTKDKPESEVSVVISKFVKDLKRKGLLNKADEIVKRFTEIYNKENGIVSARVFIDREFGDDIIEEIAKAIKERYKAEEVELAIIVDEKLKGGVKIVVGEEILDNSVVGKLGKLRKALVS